VEALALLARAVLEPPEPQILVAAAVVLDGQQRAAQQAALALSLFVMRIPTMQRHLQLVRQQ
jgi:hypothetical protein